jgi:4-hydroxybenzoate polyprenyltransferase
VHNKPDRFPIHSSSTRGAATRIALLPLKEFYVSLRFIQNDIWAGVMPGLAFTLVALRQDVTTVGGMLRALLGSLLYFWLYLYGHTLANQIVGVEEDRINKPERPLPSGLVSLAGARLRLLVVTVLLLLAGWGLGVLRWAALWVVTYLLLNFYGHKHWFWKNSLPMSVGALAMLCAAWELVLPMTMRAWQAAGTIAGFVALTSPIQDFRDIAGDRLLQRKTLPISLGERPARIVVALALLVWLPVAALLLMRPALGTPFGWAFAIAIFSLVVTVAVRLLRYQGPAADHRTYRLYEYLYCLYVLSTIAFLFY